MSSLQELWDKESKPPRVHIPQWIKNSSDERILESVINIREVRTKLSNPNILGDPTERAILLEVKKRGL